MKVIAKFYWYCGRMGDLEGLFVTDKAELEGAYGKHVYFGEVLGKHSDISGSLETEDITILSEDQDFIEKFEKIVGGGTISGYNPLEFIYEEDEEEEE